LSPHRKESLLIKLEVDTKPPAGAVLETTLVRHHLTLRLQHHDRSSLLAGKLHAILQRPYPKGRDIYDLIWYLSDRSWPGPNLVLLNNALQQTSWAGPEVTEESWQGLVRERVATFDWERVSRTFYRCFEPEGLTRQLHDGERSSKSRNKNRLVMVVAR
jgi:hypothetical protein